MGYTTEFDGEVEVVPPLNEAERDYLIKFADTRRMDRHNGPYFVGGSGFMGQGHDDDVIEYNDPPAGQPGLWCQWVPSDDGEAIAWNGTEKFYDAAEWMAYVIDHFLKPGAVASTVGDEQFSRFTFDHHISGRIEAQGEEMNDRWAIVVEDNVVRPVAYEMVERSR